MKNGVFPGSIASRPLDSSLEGPLYRQLYDRIRQAILCGNLSPGSKLPSTRALSQQLCTSRNTVMNAFVQLLAEGYLTGRIGSGTYVSRSLPEQHLYAPRTTSRPKEKANRNAAPSRRGAALMSIPSSYSRQQETICAFRHGLPAVDAFPFDLWARLTARIWRRKPYRLLHYGDPAGYRPLREAIAAYLGTSRGVRCSPDQVIVVSGSQQAIELAANVLLDAGDGVWVENPGYLGARGALSAAGLRLFPVQVDEHGFNLPDRVDPASRIRMAYVTPAHQYPLGMMMSMARRIALLDWAQQTNAWVLEDDYDSEYRYSGRPLAALQGIDPHGRVIYVGTFSKVLFPSLRIAYLVVPSALVDAFVSARMSTDTHTSTMTQAVVAEFLASGQFTRHIRRMRQLYAERQEMLLRAGNRELGEMIEFGSTDAGMHLVAWFRDGSDDRIRTAQAAARGIAVTPLSSLGQMKNEKSGVLLGYTAFNSRTILEGVKRLASAWQK